MKQSSVSPSVLASQIATAWVASYRDAPEDPTSSDSFQQIPDILDDQLQEDMHASLDPMLSSTFDLIGVQENKEVAVEFMQVILPHFDNITEEEQKDPRVGAFVALPIIGFKEHAITIAEQMDTLDFTSDLIEAGILAKGTQVKWLSKPLSMSQVGEWGADMRRDLLVAALEGRPIDDYISDEAVASFDRADLSMLVGVLVALQSDVEQSMQDPAFLYANPDDFEERPDASDTDEWALERRIAATDSASESMTGKLVDIGIEGVVIEQPGLLSEVLGSLASWSIRAQMMQEMAWLGCSVPDHSDPTQEVRADVSIDAQQSLLSVSLDIGGRVWGPYQTDWPWKNLPMMMITENFLRQEIVSHPDQITWHMDEGSMWKSAQSSPNRKWRLQ